MSALLDIASWILVLGGGFFSVIAGIGLLRLPDVYCRAHAVSINDTLGAGLMVAGLLLQTFDDGNAMTATKLILILGFLFLTSPAVDHALAKAAYAWGQKVDAPVVGETETETEA